MSGFGTHGVELVVGAAFGYAPYATPSWTDISKYVHRVDIRRGVGVSPIPRATAGTCRITLDNDDSRFDPNNSSSPYDPDVTLTVPIRVQAVWNSTTYDLFRGYVTSWDVDYPHTGSRSVVRVSCADGLQLLNQTNLVGETYETEAMDDRIGAILDDAGWPAGWRSLDEGLSQAAPVTGGTSALAMLNACAIADSGRIFIDASGDVVYQNRIQYAGGASSSGTFGPADLPYATIDLAYDDRYLYNEAVATRIVGGDVTIRIEAPSVAVEEGGISGSINVDAPIAGEHATVPWTEIVTDVENLVDALEALAPVTAVEAYLDTNNVTGIVTAVLTDVNPTSALWQGQVDANADPSDPWPVVFISGSATDQVDGTEVPAQFTIIVVPASEPVTQYASDATSVTDNRARTLPFAGLICYDDAEALSVAEWLVGRYKDMDTRVQRITVKPQVDPSNLWPVCLGLDLRDAVTVKTAPRGGGDGLNQTVTVEQLSHTITVDRWLVSVGCHPLSAFDTADYWILGTSDDLGSDTVLA